MSTTLQLDFQKSSIQNLDFQKPSYCSKSKSFFSVSQNACCLLYFTLFSYNEGYSSSFFAEKFLQKFLEHFDD